MGAFVYLPHLDSKLIVVIVDLLKSQANNEVVKIVQVNEKFHIVNYISSMQQILRDVEINIQTDKIFMNNYFSSYCSLKDANHSVFLNILFHGRLTNVNIILYMYRLFHEKGKIRCKRVAFLEFTIQLKTKNLAYKILFTEQVYGRKNYVGSNVNNRILLYQNAIPI